MKWVVVLVVFASCMLLGSAYESCYNPVSETYFECSFRCCTGYYYGTCCVSGASYWYAWLLLTLFFLVCVCACAGCGYGYRRRYVVRHHQVNAIPPPVVVTTANTAGYQQFGNQYKGYEPPPPPYSSNPY